ncbi:hypothetical protein L1987_78216 [Smallanthus sonchifolius]|uniref:Uncharacterized protein n=1 Tax=Smallanthus sonchifolius TaxID=185202 RepID=A0ACB8ZC20_9ASTR|nr:hypothetical protein L1987_78216 [Smallanthus sonchifolius]
MFWQSASCISMDLAYVYELVPGAINVNRSADKGYETTVKDGFCDEVKDIISGFLNHPFDFFMCAFHSLDNFSS